MTKPTGLSVDAHRLAVPQSRLGVVEGEEDLCASHVARTEELLAHEVLAVGSEPVQTGRDGCVARANVVT